MREGIAMDLSEAEIARLVRARAIARQKALMEAATIVAQCRQQIMAANPGRGRGTVSQAGQFAADALARAADAIAARRDEVEVPND